VQAWPSIQLELTDANDKPVLRRVFGPADYLPQGVSAAAGFAARSEQPVRLNFALTDLKPSGYHIIVSIPSFASPIFRNHHDQDCADLRLDRLRQDHAIPRPLRRNPAGRPAAPRERLLPGADPAHRIRRLRRQHRLQPQDAGRRSADHGHHRPGRRRLPRAHGKTGTGDQGDPHHRPRLHRPVLRHGRPGQQPDQRLPPGRDAVLAREQPGRLPAAARGDHLAGRPRRHDQARARLRRARRAP
jgi:hypothetical protein